MATKLNDQSKPVRISYLGKRIFYHCPKCGKPLVFRKLYQGKSLCVLCGQRLDWSPVESLLAEVVPAEDSVAAAIIAEKYYNACGMDEKDWRNLNDFRKSLIGNGPVDLYLFFRNPKEYGRFKRSMR